MVRANRLLSIVLLIALFARLAALLYFASISVKPDSWEYEDIARNLAGGKGFQNIFQGAVYRSCTPPLYPYLCAVLYELFGVNYIPVVLMHIAVSLAMCALIFHLGRRLANDMTGIVASFLYAVHPGFIVYSVAKLHPLVIDSFLLTLTLWAFVYLYDEPGVNRGFVTGAIAGLCMLTRSTIALFVPVALLWLVVARKNRAKGVFYSAIAIFAGMCIVVSPWVARNFAVHKEIVSTISTDTMAFWRGNNPYATGTSYTLSGRPILAADKETYDKIIKMSELGQRNFFRKEAYRFIRQHPKKFIELFLKKLYYFWWFSPSAGINYPHPYFVVYKYAYVSAAVFFLIGSYGAITRKAAVDMGVFALFLLFLASISVFQSLFYVDGRHRWGVEPVFLIIAAAGILSLSGKLKIRNADKPCGII